MMQSENAYFTLVAIKWYFVCTAFGNVNINACSRSLANLKSANDFFTCNCVCVCGCGCALSYDFCHVPQTSFSPTKWEKCVQFAKENDVGKDETEC